MTLAIQPDTNAAVQQMVRKISAIASLPEITAKIVATVQDPNGNARQLHQIVSHDPALVTRILKVVNSAFYGLPGQIASIERAIVLLGLNAVKNIAVAASLGQLFKGVKLCEGYTARDLWKHCIAVSVVARELARQMRVPLGDEAFLAGMIHDIGILVSLQLQPDRLSEACESARSAAQHFCDVENRVCGVDHQRLGAALCELWKFPRSCQLVAGYHHRPNLLDKNNRLLVSLIHAADTLCCHAGQGFSLTAAGQQLDAEELGDVGLELAIVEQVRAKLPDLVANSASVFA